MSHPKRTLGRCLAGEPLSLRTVMHAKQRVVCGEWAADIDIGIAPFVLELWRAGIETHNSCQDIGEMLLADPDDCAVDTGLIGRATVALSFPGDLFTLYALLADHGPLDDFYERMTNPWALGGWEHWLGVIDDRLDHGDMSMPASFSPFGVEMTLPTTDIAEATRRLRSANAARMQGE